MNANVQFFSNPQFGNIRTLEINNKMWFGATDVATALGYSNPRDAIVRHCKPNGVVIHDVGVQTGIKSDGTSAIQNVQMKFINEGNVYRLVASSQLPKADEFESWIFDEVIPSVVHTGGYLLTKQEDTPEMIMARALQVAQKTIEMHKSKVIQLTTQLDNARPALIFTESVKVSNNNILMRDLAKIITQNGYQIGEQWLYDWMVKHKYLIRSKRWSKTNSRYQNYYTPTQSAAEKGLFWVSERSITNPDQETFISFTCYITGQGQVYFINKFNKLKAA